MKIEPWGLVKYEVSAREAAFSLDLAAFSRTKTQPNRVFLAFPVLKPRVLRVILSFMLFFGAFGCSWGSRGGRGRPREAPGAPQELPGEAPGGARRPYHDTRRVSSILKTLGMISMTSFQWL